MQGRFHLYEGYPIQKVTDTTNTTPFTSLCVFYYLNLVMMNCHKHYNIYSINTVCHSLEYYINIYTGIYIKMTCVKCKQCVVFAHTYDV